MYLPPWIRTRGQLFASRTHKSTRKALVAVHEFCPQRAYVELTVPNARAVTAASFTTISRDQGWADSTEASYTWFEVAVHRPGGNMSDIWPIGIQRNRAANPRFAKATTRWDIETSESRPAAWLRSLRPGDVIQIIPKAAFVGWVNIVSKASIKIEYQPAGEVHDITLRHTSTAIPAEYYRPFEHAGEQIRLLIVKPGSYDDAIQASFAYTSLASPANQQTTETDFDALSYCWGDSPDRVDIHFETENHAATGLIRLSASVGRALRRLRSQHRPLRIWIDAVCINQQDHKERSQQVSIMGDIYSRAKAVHIWLDEEDNPGHGAALRITRDIHNVQRRVCPGGGKCSCRGAKHFISSKDIDAIKERALSYYDIMLDVFRLHMDAASSLGASSIKDPASSTWELMQTLLEHPWFQRVWVVQEAILSRNATFVHCGKETINWDELLMIAESLELTDPPQLRGRIRMPTVWKTLGGTRNLLPLLDVFLAALDMKATDQRDKVFALLALSRETCQAIPPSLRPDYSKDPMNVMADFTRWCIGQYRSLDVFSFIHCHPTRAWQRTLGDCQSATTERPTPWPASTWAIGTEGVSSWSTMTLLRQFPQFRAAADTVPDEKLLEQDRGALVLRLRGYKLGTITSLQHLPEPLIDPPSTIPPDPTTPTATHFTSVFHRMFDPAGTSGLWAHPGTSSMVDLKRPPSHPPDTFFGDHLRAHHYVSATDQSGRIIPHSHLPLPCLHACYFAASDGSRGLCPWTVREGDVVAVLHGGRVPYVLRPALPTDRGREGGMEYYLVGECFVDRADVMDGGVVMSKGGDASDGEPLVFVLV
ncbi:putative heterokaryon incompatibility protein [Staphylotrichum tortipilum]|uniref:Heterokaryon incompatibility protein n=1 Tax=Staphylotrichum tortipilum TaxID=2831512 RepID=A0AAN6RRU9_9PEZI|nr:putative heterokaryon incompatibility protein [Staphylotrichum longicolle]